MGSALQPQRRRRSDGRAHEAPFGVYVHIPFCAARCDYCAFATWTDRHHLVAEYLDAVQAEIDRAVGGRRLGPAV